MIGIGDRPPLVASALGRAARVLGVMLVMAVGPGQGQTVQGQVSDSISGIPVGRGFVALLDATGREVIRTLADADGRFMIATPTPGVYRVRSERIAYRAWESAPIRVAPGQSYRVDPRINPLPRELASINITTRSACERRKGPDTGLLWDEASKALRAATWSAEQELYLHHLHRAQREMDRGRNRLISESVTVHTVRDALPFVSRDPPELAELGYITVAGNTWDYWAPDATVLLDPSFHETHCFWAVRGEDRRAGYIGLAFEPVPGRTRSDVEGVLWLDEASSELRDVEFTYTGLPFGMRSDAAGGWATFMPMPSGAWILAQWQIRIPILERRPFGRARISGYRVADGRVFRVMDLGGNQVYEDPNLVTVRGTAYDSILGVPLAGTVVSFENTEYTAETDGAGRFSMQVLLEGGYALTTARHHWLGYRPGIMQLKLVPGDTVDVELAVPSLSRVHRYLCRRADAVANLVMHGEVRDLEDKPINDAEVVARWEPGVERKYKTDADGRYVLCSLPKDTRITVTMRHDAYAVDTLRALFTGPVVVIEVAGVRESYRVPDRVVRLSLRAVRTREF